MKLKDEHFERLSDAVSRGEVRAAFEAAHALKGAIGNLALSPL